MSPSPPDKENSVHAEVLSVISYVGSAISLTGVFLTLLTYLLFK